MSLKVCRPFLWMNTSMIFHEAPKKRQKPHCSVQKTMVVNANTYNQLVIGLNLQRFQFISAPSPWHLPNLEKYWSRARCFLNSRNKSKCITIQRHSRNVQHGCFKACPLGQSNTKKQYAHIWYFYLSIYLSIHLRSQGPLQISLSYPDPASYQPCTGFSLGGLIQKHQSPLPHLESGFG